MQKNHLWKLSLLFDEMRTNFVSAKKDEIFVNPVKILCSA